MTKAPAFQLYADNFLAGTADMSAEEVGVYFRLLCQQWSKGSLPDDINKLMRLSGGKKKAVDAVAIKFAKGDDGLLRNERLEKERVKQKTFSDSRKANALHRWSKSSASAANVHEPSNALQSSSSVLGQRERGGVPEWTKSPEAAIALCAGAGVPEEFIRRVWLQHDGTTWKDSQGREIGNFKSYVTGRFHTERSYRSEKAAKTGFAPEPAKPSALRERWDANDEGLSWNQFREKYQKAQS